MPVAEHSDLLATAVQLEGRVRVACARGFLLEVVHLALHLNHLAMELVGVLKQCSNRCLDWVRRRLLLRQQTHAQQRDCR